MPAPPLYQNFDGGGGSNGTVISAANSGGGGNTAVSTVTDPNSIQKYSSAQAAHGGLSMNITQTATGAATRWNWTALGSLTVNVWFRQYMYLPALPTAAFFTFGARDQATAALCGQLDITTSGFVRMDASAGTAVITGTVAVPTNQWFRVEWRIKASTTVGELEFWLYKTMDSTTFDDHVASAATQNTGANIDEARWGHVTNPIANYSSYHDDIGVSTVGPLGPAGFVRPKIVIPTVAPIRAATR